ncbi:hypothetical protein LHJ74_30100 [Streptomyces sp. N2-109]|uniref:ABC transmembrane type-1 domain-containing protein n=1 Tax=Streptomyces gossypii TaxID=2883101 RepID=A0ABT2K1S7_9ACTN|nr:hypothetical protein [Streptomyces gossypii]MCT2594111.1 hypothetical protein [Streptomyces gossypii]
MMRLASDPHFEASVNLATWAMARRLPHTLMEAIRLGWRTDRRAVIALALCQLGAAAFTSTALAATTRVLAAVFTGDDIAAGLGDNLTAVVVLALAASGRYLLDAAARAPAARLAPRAVREADLKVIAAATAAELAAYEDPGFEDALAAASDGAEKTGELILEAQLLTSAAAQMAAAATVVTVLHPMMLPLLVASVIPCAWGAVRGHGSSTLPTTATLPTPGSVRSSAAIPPSATRPMRSAPAPWPVSSSTSTASSPATWRPNSSRPPGRPWWYRASATRSPPSAPPRPGVCSSSWWRVAGWSEAVPHLPFPGRLGPLPRGGQTVDGPLRFGPGRRGRAAADQRYGRLLHLSRRRPPRARQRQPGPQAR